MRRCLLLALVVGAPLWAQQADAIAALFDGRSLAGWEGAPGIWSVRDGCIVGSTVGAVLEHNTFLCWQGGELADFVVEFDVRLEGDNNSGLQYRSHRVGADGFQVAGYQCDVHAEPDFLGQLYEEGGRGFVAHRGQKVACAADGSGRVVGALAAPRRVDLAQWHHFQVTARGQHLRHVVDGEVAVEVDDGATAAARRGILALQLHAGPPMTVWFKNLTLVRLPTEEVAAAQSHVAAPVAAAGGPAPQWIWDESPQDGEELFFRRVFALPAACQRANLAITCDNHCRVQVNGERVCESNDWQAVRFVDLGKLLVAGDNVVAVHAWNDGNVAGLCARLDWATADGKRGTVVTDGSWRCSADDPDGWDRQRFDDSRWPAARELAALGQDGAPWSAVLGRDAFDELRLDVVPEPPQPAPELKLTEPNWTAERLLRVPRGMGSWVCMAPDPKGRIYASDQTRGLYRVTPAGVGGQPTTTVERVEVDLDGCQGLQWAHDALYAVVSSSRSGLYRLRDTDGDDRLDQVELLRRLDGEGEHGPHAVHLDADGEHLLVMCGNHTRLPELARSRLPRNWGEDRVLPQIEDPNGHAVGIKAPGGFLCRTDRDGREWELLCAGFRNAYDFAVGFGGELWTYDSDMEWDMGLPWYRPTTLLHLTSGADFGWRSGTDRWPEDYPDTLPVMSDVGPGSPTGMVLTDGRLLFLDWTFGTVYRAPALPAAGGAPVVPTPFLTGQPLPLTAILGDHHAGHTHEALLLLTGGRGLPSQLYRVAFHPDPPGILLPPPQTLTQMEWIQQRCRLEQFHGHADPQAVDAAWPSLGADEPFLRYAARIAVEWQPVAQWRQRALAETDPQRAVTALLALARQGDASDLEPVLDALGRLADGGLKDEHLLDWVRVHQLACIRLGKPAGALRDRTIARLFARWPEGNAAGDERSRQELTALLCALDAPGIVDKALPLMLRADPEPIPAWAEVTKRNATYGGVIQKMLADMPPVTAISYATALRTVAHGWTLEQREQYFRCLAAARKQPGGASYGGYLKHIWNDAMATCTPAERSALAATVGEKLPEPPPFRATPPRGPGRDWQLDDAVALARRGLTGRDFAAGHNLFFAASCAVCHRFAGEGGNVGPDLTSLGNKFGAADVLEAILDPSKVVSDQYAGVLLTRKDGHTVFGRLQRSVVDGVDTWVGTAATAEATAVAVPAADVAKVERSRLSPMPAGLVSPLNEHELLDLLAFLLSRGDEKSPMFAR